MAKRRRGSHSSEICAALFLLNPNESSELHTYDQLCFILSPKREK